MQRYRVVDDGEQWDPIDDPEDEIRYGVLDQEDDQVISYHPTEDEAEAEAERLNDEAEAEETVRSCPVCGAPDAPMGNLGRIAHYSCRACGCWYSHDPREE